MKTNSARTRLLAWFGAASAFAILALAAFGAKADSSASAVSNPVFELKRQAGLQIANPSNDSLSLEILDLQVEPLEILDVVVPSLGTDGLGVDFRRLFGKPGSWGG